MTLAALGERLNARIADGFCWPSESPIELFENSKEGEAKVVCSFSADAVGLVFQLDRVGFPFLRPQKSVDWLLLLRLPDGSIDAHLFECKRTIDSTTWRDVKAQLSSSKVRALTLGGALGVEVARFFCYTAFRRDRLSSRSSPDPVFAKVSIGSAAIAAGEPTASREARTRAFDWRDPTISLDEIDAPVPHCKVQLDEVSGVGRVELLGADRATSSSRPGS